MNLVELVAIDIDRTTLTADFRLLPSVVEAVRRARESGIAVIPATARSPEELMPVAEALGLESCCVCLNGAWAGPLDRDAPLLQRTMDPEATRELIREAENAGLNPLWFSPDNAYALSIGDMVQRHFNAVGLVPYILNSLDGPLAPILKILCLENPARGTQIQGIRDTFGTRFEFARSDRYLVEVTAAGVSKKSAVESVATQFGVQQAEVAAIGDSENDLEMIAWANLGIAVSNAESSVLEVADWITASNDEGGVATALDRIMEANAASIRNAGAIPA
ncbi:MAG: Cof-type HAD-IIB family hydrolase [Rhodospirillaceae bacterium]|nr:Cof-type HAD-IIB family hydrolase [Rhodospirillaceae bacterium]